MELGLPPNDRSAHGNDFLRQSRAEFDRLIEQSPTIPKCIIIEFEQLWEGVDIAKPEILSVKPVNIFSTIGERVQGKIQDKAEDIMDTLEIDIEEGIRQT